MDMRPLKLPEIRPSEITAERYFHMRRGLLAGALGLAGASLLPAPGRAAAAGAGAPRHFSSRAIRAMWSPTKPNSFEEITGYNNFYEFGLDKSDPAANAGSLRTRPWNLTIAGEAELTGTFHLEDILKAHPLEERIYRHRCVEGWSMVIPWVGFPLS